MEKQMLRCDICGGELEIQGSGKAVCASCGMKYSIESLREKLQGLKTSVTGSSDDVAQWEMLLDRYMSSFDYFFACEIAEKILQAQPDNDDVYELHTKLLEWKNLEVNKNGKLIRYHGHAENLELPIGIKAIGSNAFGCKNPRKRSLSSVFNDRRIDDAVPIKSIVIPSSVEIIESPEKESESGAFSGCDLLNSVVLYDGLQEIGAFAFYGCTALCEITIPQTVKYIGSSAFEQCITLDGCIDLSSVTHIGAGAFVNCRNVSKFVIGTELKHAGINSLYTLGPTKIEYTGSLNIDEATGVAELRRHKQRVEEENKKKEETRRREKEEQKSRQQSNWRSRSLCQYCGGTFKGLFSKKCVSCGCVKDY